MGGEGIGMKKIFYLVSLITATILLLITAFVGDHAARQPDLCTNLSGDSTIYTSKPGRPHCVAQRAVIFGVGIAFFVGVVQVFAAVINLVAKHTIKSLCLAHGALILLAVIAIICIIVALKKENDLSLFEAPSDITRVELAERRIILTFMVVLLIADIVGAALTIATIMFK